MFFHEVRRGGGTPLKVGLDTGSNWRPYSESAMVSSESPSHSLQTHIFTRLPKRSGRHVRRHTSFSTSSSNLKLTATTLVTNPLQALLTRNISKTCTSRIHMAPGRVKKFLASLLCARAAHFRRPHKSHGDPVTTETAATDANNPTGDMSSFAPVAVTRHSAEDTASADLNAEPGSLTGEMTGLGTTIKSTPPPATFHMDPEKAKKYLENIEKFRILVIGRGNAGKTTILQRVCNSVDEPDVFDGEGNKINNDVVQGTLGRGYHKIDDELVFKSNPGFVFHDSGV